MHVIAGSQAAEQRAPADLGCSAHLPQALIAVHGEERTPQRCALGDEVPCSRDASAYGVTGTPVWGAVVSCCVQSTFS